MALVHEQRPRLPTVDFSCWVPTANLMRLNPLDGQIVWQIDLREVAKREPPTWGFSSSPLVVDSTVIVHAGGEGDKGTLAFDIDNW